MGRRRKALDGTIRTLQSIVKHLKTALKKKKEEGNLLHFAMQYKPCVQHLIRSGFVQQQDSDTKHNTLLCKNYLGMRQWAGLYVKEVPMETVQFVMWSLGSTGRLNFIYIGPLCTIYFKCVQQGWFTLTYIDIKILCQRVILSQEAAGSYYCLQIIICL